MVEFVPGIPILKPYIDADNKPYWDAVKEHKFVVQQCSKCKNYYHIPRPMCPECHTLDTMEFVPSSGKGVVYSYIIYTTDRMAYPGMKIPYAVMVVELEEGIRIVANNSEDIDPEEVHIGMPVELTFVDVDDALTLYQFKKREA
jgi:uncharacterized OB-fold protein